MRSREQHRGGRRLAEGAAAHVEVGDAVAEPKRPASIDSSAIPAGSTMPPPIVFATASDEKAPRTLSRAANTTASFGEIAFVATGTATAFGESWNPLVKSNISPSPTIKTT
jgi:hypothetical protein